MIDELGTTSPYRSIEPRAPIQANCVGPLCFSRQEHPGGASHDLSVTNPFAGKLDDPLALRNRLFCEHAKPIDLRTANEEHETGELQIETRNEMFDGHIYAPNRRGLPVSNRQPYTREKPLMAHSDRGNDCKRLSVLERLGPFQLFGRVLLCHVFFSFLWVAPIQSFSFSRVSGNSVLSGKLLP